MLITRSPFTLDNPSLPRVYPSAGVVGYTHRWSPYDIEQDPGDTCPAWVDHAGELTLAGTNGPTVRTLPAGVKYLEFDGTNDTLKSDAVVAGDVVTFIMLARSRSTDSGTTILVSGNGVTISRAGTNGTQLNPGTPALNPTKLDSTWRFVAAVVTPSAAHLIIDGTKVTATPNGTFGTSLRLAANGTPAYFASLDVIEVITYPSALTDAQIATVRSTMSTTYTGLLS